MLPCYNSGRMPAKASIAKITRPVLPKVLLRTRLFSLLDEGLDAPITWVSGPAGSGKTTLIASYIDSRRLPCLWYQMDEGDNDIPTFFHYLGLAVKKTSPRHKTSLPPLTADYMSGLAAFTRRYFESLYLRLKPPGRSSAKAKNGRFVIVLDNYHHILPGSVFHDIAREALFAIPDGISVIIVSRGMPPPSLALFRTYRKIRLIGWDELKFDMNETETLLRSGHRPAMHDQIVERLHRMTTGWAAGLVLIMERLRRLGDEDHDSGTFRTGEMFDYFATEIFEKTDREMQAFLLKTSFLPLITPHAAAALTGRNDSGTLLALLNSHHFFTEQRSVSDPVYQYHPLFREFLQTRARETCSGSEMVDIMRSAASLLEQAEMIEDAAGLYRRSECWDGVVRLILANAEAMVAQGRTRPLEEWLGCLPAGILNREPWLLYWMGVCSMPYRLPDARGYFERSLSLFRRQRDAEGIYLAWSGAVEAVFQEMGDIRRLEPWVGLFNEIQREYGFPPPGIEAQVTIRIFTALRWRRDNPQFSLWNKKALNLMDSEEDAGLRMLTGFYLHSYHVWWAGDYTTGRRVLDVMDRIAGMKHELPPLVRTMQKAAASLFAMLEGSHEHCMKMFSEGLAISNESGVHIWDGVLLMSAAASCLCTGDLANAGQYLDKMGSTLEVTRPFDRFYYYHMSAWRLMLMNDIPRAVACEKMALDLASKTGFEIAEAQAAFAMGHLMRCAGEHKSAQEHIFRCKETGGRMGSTIVEFMTLLSETTLALDRGDEETGLSRLRDAMNLGRANGYLYFCWWHASMMAPLCVKALEAGIEIDYVKGLIRTCRLFPEEPPLQIEAWPWPIRIYTLGRFEIVIEGKPLRFTGKVQKKPLEMLKVLIASGGEDVSENRIIDTLWPEADGDAARIAFKAALHRLRRLLGREEFIQLKEGRLSLNGRYCWVDSSAFEKIVETGDAAMRQAGSTRKSPGRCRQSEKHLSIFEKALCVYRGHFLAGDMDEDWSRPLRERLRARYLRAVNILGEYRLRETGQSGVRKAVEYYEQGLAVDDAAEEFYQNLMVCYRRLGNKAEAIRAYRRCREALHSALGVEPSEETERLYREIKAGG